MNRKIAVRDMALIATFAALSIALSFLKVFQMPQGGSITLYLIPIMFIAIRLNFKSAFVCCLIVAIVQVMNGYILGVFQVGLDYILPVCAISLLAFVKEGKNVKLIIALILVGIIMLSSYVLSGMIYFEASFEASLIYNATFFVPMYVLSSIIALMLTKAVPEFDHIS